jgi:hypothetical protein
MRGRLTAPGCSTVAGYRDSCVAAVQVCTAYGVRDAQVVCLPAALFRDCLRGDSAFAYAFSLRMATAARNQCSRYERLRLGQASERLLHLLNCETGAVC